jgi:ATP sulfurylase
MNIYRHSSEKSPIAFLTSFLPRFAMFVISSSHLSYSVSQRQLCDLELIINGGFSPLEGFINEKDYKRCGCFPVVTLISMLITLCSVVDCLRLVDGTLFPIPVTLDLSHEDIVRLSIKPGARITLRDPRDDESLAIITSLLYSSTLLKTL